MINYKWVKGYNGDGKWTWIEFVNDQRPPRLYMSATNNKDTATGFGEFVVTYPAVPQVIQKMLTRTSWLSVENGLKVIQGDVNKRLFEFYPAGTGQFKVISDRLTIKNFEEDDRYAAIGPTDTDGSHGIVFTRGQHQFRDSGLDIKSKEQQAYLMFTYGSSQMTMSPNNNLAARTGSVYCNGNMIFQSGNLNVQNGYVEATYFNATSDRRAKKDIKPLELNALNVVNRTPIYTYIYKDSNTPSIGVMAQDVKNYELDNFSLVENKDASGENGDYMSVHESKLVYVLWKAVQELTQEVSDLKAQLNK